MWEVEEVSRITLGGAIALLLNMKWVDGDVLLTWEGIKLTLPNNPNARQGVLNAFRVKMGKTRDALLAAPAPEMLDQVIEDSLNA